MQPQENDEKLPAILQSGRSKAFCTYKSQKIFKSIPSSFMWQSVFFGYSGHRFPQTKRSLSYERFPICHLCHSSFSFHICVPLAVALCDNRLNLLQKCSKIFDPFWLQHGSYNNNHALNPENMIL